MSCSVEGEAIPVGEVNQNKNRGGQRLLRAVLSTITSRKADVRRLGKNINYCENLYQNHRLEIEFGSVHGLVCKFGLTICRHFLAKDRGLIAATGGAPMNIVRFHDGCNLCNLALRISQRFGNLCIHRRLIYIVCCQKLRFSRLKACFAD